MHCALKELTLAGAAPGSGPEVPRVTSTFLSKDTSTWQPEKVIISPFKLD